MGSAVARHVASTAPPPTCSQPGRSCCSRISRGGVAHQSHAFAESLRVTARTVVCGPKEALRSHRALGQKVEFASNRLL